MILYSHRPKLGVSVAVQKVGDRLALAVAITNRKLDTFSRERARKILQGRLESSPTIEYVTNLTVQQFMSQFKKWFKPTPDESDDTFPKKIWKRRSKIIQRITYVSTFIVQHQEPL